jgi:quinol-cytochrome oxidoreductase complex cytochrome b subunit
VVVDATRALLRFLGPWGLALFTLVGFSLALVPLFDREPERSLRQRPGMAVLALLFFVGFVVAWLVGGQLEGPAPSRPAAEPVQPSRSADETPEGERSP